MEIKENIQKTEEIEQKSKKSKKNQKKSKFFLKIKYNLEDIKKHFRVYFKSKEFKITSQALFDILFYGLICNGIYYIFTTKFNLLYLLFFGFGFWLFEIKVLDWIKQLLSSFKLVEVRK